MRKIFRVLAMFMACIGLFAACTGKKEEPSVNPNNPSGTSERIIQINKDKVLSSIVSNSKSDYTIVIPNSFSETEYTAAIELQSFIEQSTGVKLAISLDTAVEYTDKACLISIGNTSLLEEQNFDIDYAKLNTDGFIMKTVGKSLFIDGANDRGTIYGAWDFLERYIGVRFLSDDYTYVPNINSLDLYDTNIIDMPAFSQRIYLAQNLYNDPAFLARMRMHSEHTVSGSQYGGAAEWQYKCHSTLRYVPTTYAEEHPEFFAWDKGAIVDLCMTNGITDDGKVDKSMEISTFTVVLESMKELIRITPESVVNFDFSQQDNWTPCTCTRCMEHSALYKRSGVNVRFANCLAQEIEKWITEEYGDRDFNIVIFAYEYSIDAPVNENGEPIDETCRPNEHIAVRLASTNANYYYPLSDTSKNPQMAVAFNQWGAITDNLMSWTYHTSYAMYGWWFPTINTWRENLTWLDQLGTKYVLMQGDHTNQVNWQSKLNVYVASKMLWNPYQDVNTLIDEYIRLYFGIVADDMLSLIHILNQKVYDIEMQSPEQIIHIYSEKLFEVDWWPLTFVENLMTVVDNAIVKVQNSTLTMEEKTAIVKRINEVKVTPYSMLIYNIDTYYSFDSQKQKELVSDYIRFVTEMEFDDISENVGGNTITIDKLKEKYGL